MKIFLMGMPGCGKSTLGHQLAYRLSIRFVDLDNEIERRERKTISVLFKTCGSDYFREKERDALMSFCASNEPFVMATGGGTPCFFSNMQRINATGISFFLDVPIEELFDRLRYSRSVPYPLLSDEDQSLSVEHIAVLRERRLAMYRQAKYIFLGNRIDVDIILKKYLIIRSIDRKN